MQRARVRARVSRPGRTGLGVVDGRELVVQRVDLRDPRPLVTLVTVHVGRAASARTESERRDRDQSGTYVRHEAQRSSAPGDGHEAV